MFEPLLKLMKELYDENAAPSSWSEIIYDKFMESGYDEMEAKKVADAAEAIGDVFADEMYARLEEADPVHFGRKNTILGLPIK